MTRMLAVSAMACLVLLFTGCGSGSPPRAPAAGATVAPSLSAHIATTQQYASIIAKAATDIRSNSDTLSNCLGPKDGGACPIVPVTLEFEAKTLIVEIDGAEHPSPGNQLYIGQPPQEIASLVTDTVNDAKAVAAAAEAYTRHQTSNNYVAIQFRARSLASDMDAWKPYSNA